MTKPKQPRYSEIFAGNDEGRVMAEMAQVLWAKYASDLEDRDLFTPARAETLDRLVRATVEYKTNYPVAVAQGPVFKSKDGNDYVNMLWSMCGKLNEQIMKLEKSLLLTPESVKDKVPAKKKADGVTGADKYLARHVN